MSYPANKQTSTRRERGPIVNFPRFSMWAPIGENRRAQLVFGTQDGNPRITVFYPKKDASDTKTPSSTAAMGFTDMLAFLDVITAFMKQANNNGQFVKVENLRNTYENGSERPTGRSVSTVTIFGRDDEGRYYMQIKDMVYPKQDATFYFDRSDWHVFYVTTPEGNKQVGRAAMSHYMAQGMFSGIRDVLIRMNMPAAAGVPVGNPAEPIDTTPAAPTKHEDLPY